MMGEVKTRCLLLAMILWLAIPSALKAQEFSVASFRQLPNDVSAFINNVRDLNDEACALIKVVAPSDFAFSSPSPSENGRFGVYHRGQNRYHDST